MGLPVWAFISQSAVKRVMFPETTENGQIQKFEVPGCPFINLWPLCSGHKEREEPLTFFSLEEPEVVEEKS